MILSSESSSPYRVDPPLIRALKSETCAWALIVGAYLFTLLGIFLGGARFIPIFFPAVTTAVALLLYFRFPLLYVGFNWWLWFLTPLVRRLVDYKTGYTEFSLVLLAPLLVTFITVISLVRYIPKVLRSYGLPFVLSIASILFCLCLGLVNFQLAKVVRNFLDILLPVSFGFYIILNWRNYPALKTNIKRVFLWGVLLMGVYGIFQFLVCPDWDGLWLLESPYNSGGNPEPLKVRVWSTLNSAGPFAGVMAGGLLLLLISPTRFTPLATVVGALSFILSRHRASWVSWIVGFLFVAGAAPAKKQIRMMIFISLLGLVLVGISSLDQFSASIGDRFGTLGSLQNDGSALARKAEWDEYFLPALSTVFGNGLGGLGHDNGILYFLLNLGWSGTVLYFAGLFVPLKIIFQSPYAKQDEFIVVSRAIAISLLIQMPTSIPILHVTGMVIWGFMSYAMAGHLYYRALATQSNFSGIPIMEHG
ncbi:MAG: O-antigen ligase domain-containing protein, partial [Cyanobacteria bacterium P01_F01_bin.42]